MPCHASFTDIAIDAARNGHNVIDEIGSADGWGNEMQITDLKWQQEKGSGNSSHRSKEGNHKSNEWRKEKPGGHT